MSIAYLARIDRLLLRLNRVGPKATPTSPDSFFCSPDLRRDGGPHCITDADSAHACALTEMSQDGPRSKRHRSTDPGSTPTRPEIGPDSVQDGSQIHTTRLSRFQGQSRGHPSALDLVLSSAVGRRSKADQRSACARIGVDQGSTWGQPRGDLGRSGADLWPIRARPTLRPCYLALSELPKRSLP